MTNLLLRLLCRLLGHDWQRKRGWPHDYHDNAIWICARCHAQGGVR
jgi:hypothetical protein